MNNALELFNAFAASKKLLQRKAVSDGDDAQYEQDKTDAANIASIYLGIVRCVDCKRITAERYVCMHCGCTQPDGFEEQDEIWSFD